MTPRPSMAVFQRRLEMARLSVGPIRGPRPPSPPHSLRPSWETRTLLTSCCRPSSLATERCIGTCGANAVQPQTHTDPVVLQTKTHSSAGVGPRARPRGPLACLGLPCQTRRARPKVQAALVRLCPPRSGADGFSLL